MAKIAIDAGHGRYTPGKRCMKKLDKNETREWVLNDRVADALGIYLKSAGHTTKRMDDPAGTTDVSLARRVEKANEWNAAFFISVHHNAGMSGRSGGGTEVYVSAGAQSKSKKAQNAIYKHAIKRGDLKGNRADGTKTANFYVIRYTEMAACLIECGFMDSSTDIKKILDPAWSKKIASGIAEGICEILGGKIDTSAAGGGTENEKPPADEKKIKVDGLWGRDTTNKTQKVLGTPVDSVVSYQPSVNERYLPNVITESWKFYESGYSTGSVMIQTIQKLVETEQDGWCGKMTVQGIQRFLKQKNLDIGEIDGIMGPATVKGWQKYMNRRI